jgi:ubiquinone/menaquinone biosynthesis C-methylase UbiE
VVAGAVSLGVPSIATIVDHPRVRAWLEIREQLEQQLEPLGEAAMSALQPRPGERILDVGFGIARTPSALARTVGSSGEVVGIELLQAAVDVLRSDPDLSENVTLLCGDAQTYPFEEGAFDAIFSRFGVMFFPDPTSAFRNLLRALRPDGRLGFVCWRRLEENELDDLPLRAAAPHLPPHLIADTASSNWFSFSDPESIREVLAQAGFIDVEVAAHDELVGSGTLKGMVDVCSRVGALGAILRDNPELRREALPALEEILRAIDGPLGPRLRAATWVVIARSPNSPSVSYNRRARR